jgi:hypothetical protein
MNNINRNKKSSLPKLINKILDCDSLFLLKNKSSDIEGVDIFSFNDEYLIHEIKNTRVINIDKIEDYLSYLSYDYYLIFKCDDEYYFTDTELSHKLKGAIIKLLDYNLIFRKEKITKLKEI